MDWFSFLLGVIIGGFFCSCVSFFMGMVIGYLSNEKKEIKVDIPVNEESVYEKLLDNEYRMN
ncbi:hypothetical protein KAR91_77390 [Candidatus Pacearchaeota archaeon]|nr:hypothetical protein [Candidatus Pacearchaeota archaeon]